jgi:hypothetical protein
MIVELAAIMVNDLNLVVPAALVDIGMEIMGVFISMAALTWPRCFQKS